MTDAALDIIVQLSIDSTLQTPTRPGFGTALLMSAETPAAWGSALVRKFSNAAEVAAAGFTTVAAPSTRKKVDAYFANDPRPEAIYIGRRQLKPTKVYTLTFANNAVGVVWSVTINGTKYSFTSVDTLPASAATGLAAAINAGAAGYGKAAVAAVLTLTATVPGVAPEVKDWSATLPTGPTSASLTLLDATTDPGIVSDLDACAAAPLGGEAFGLLLDSAGKLEIDAADSWAQTNQRLFAYVTSDDEVLAPGTTTDSISDGKTEGLSFVVPIYSLKNTSNPIDAGILGRCLPYTPGSCNFAHKKLANVDVQPLSATQIGTVITKGGSVYALIQGASDFYNGQTSGGTWADEVVGIAWLQAEIKISVFELFLARIKVPFTDSGVDEVKNVIKGVLQVAAAAPYNLIDPARPIVVTAPLIASLTAAQRATRKLPGVTFSAFLQGAINNVQILGRVTP